jgi:hypothetical protein
LGSARPRTGLDSGDHFFHRDGNLLINRPPPPHYPKPRCEQRNSYGHPSESIQTNFTRDYATGNNDQPIQWRESFWTEMLAPMFVKGSEVRTEPLLEAVEEVDRIVAIHAEVLTQSV